MILLGRGSRGSYSTRGKYKRKSKNGIILKNK